jgi:hypothetical protein
MYPRSMAVCPLASRTVRMDMCALLRMRMCRVSCACDCARVCARTCVCMCVCMMPLVAVWGRLAALRQLASFVSPPCPSLLPFPRPVLPSAGAALMLPRGLAAAAAPPASPVNLAALLPYLCGGGALAVVAAVAVCLCCKLGGGTARWCGGGCCSGSCGCWGEGCCCCCRWPCGSCRGGVKKVKVHPYAPNSPGTSEE